MGENEIGGNSKRAGQILGGMGKRQSWKGRKKNWQNGKNSGEMGMGETGFGKLGINHKSYQLETTYMDISRYGVVQHSRTVIVLLLFFEIKPFVEN